MKVKGTLKVNKSYEGEPIEEKVMRITTLKEPITDGAPLNYTERSDGVLPEFDIRTDRFEIAIDAMDKVNASRLASFKGMPKNENGNGEAESIQATTTE